ncbi:PPOX class probable F420-dependent enzyme [Frankineae bacterium MT45]|nr:PPOX class probable F420-dependent enzyme [Frankineae bacterium MT45]
MRLIDPTNTDLIAFWSERALSSLTTVRPDGTPHVVPVGVTLDAVAGTAWVITSGTSQKARLVATAGNAGVAAAACQVDGRRWSTLEGRAFLRDDPETIAEAVRRYALRYKQPRENPRRVVLEIVIARVLGNV